MQPLARPFQLLGQRLANREPVVRPCPPGFQEAAVLMLLAERHDGLHVLLCERSANDPRDAHKGQVSLPGGRRDPEDADILATALREAHEEVGLDPTRARVLGRLDDYLTITRYHVVPFVAAMDGFDGLAVNSAEIADIFTFPIAALRDPARVRRVPWELHGRVEDVLFIEHEGHTVWGATARMLFQLTEFIE